MAVATASQSTAWAIVIGATGPSCGATATGGAIDVAFASVGAAVGGNSDAGADPIISMIRSGGAAVGKVTTIQRIIAGIVSEANNTTTHAVMCTRGSRIRSIFRLNQTIAPSRSDRSAASRSSDSIIFSRSSSE